MMHTQEDLIRRAEQFVQAELAHDSSGHDWWHIHRVRQLAVRIAAEEGADVFICELAALLHDVADAKLNPDKESGMVKVAQWLAANEADSSTSEQILHIQPVIQWRT